jgi:hypothetical protein
MPRKVISCSKVEEEEYFDFGQLPGPPELPELVGRKMAELGGSDPEEEIETETGSVWLFWQVCMGDFICAADALAKLGYKIVRKQ